MIVCRRRPISETTEAPDDAWPSIVAILRSTSRWARSRPAMPLAHRAFAPPAAISAYHSGARRAFRHRATLGARLPTEYSRSPPPSGLTADSLFPLATIIAGRLAFSAALLSPVQRRFIGAILYRRLLLRTISAHQPPDDCRWRFCFMASRRQFAARMLFMYQCCQPAHAG